MMDIVCRVCTQEFVWDGDWKDALEAATDAGWHAPGATALCPECKSRVIAKDKQKKNAQQQARLQKLLGE